MRLDGLAAIFGADPVSVQPLHGGDLSEVFRVAFGDGRLIAVKRGSRTDCEARMLQAMAAAGAPVPRVLHQDGALLCLEWLDESPPSPAGWASLGRGLRKLHAAEGPSYGWSEDYAFGTLPIANAASSVWPGFWCERRLLPFLPRLPPPLAKRVEAVARTLPDRLPATPAPALLHGDLWTGNALFGAHRAWLIDPACYHGDGEVDLAMLELFGTPPAEFWRGYGAIKPDRAARRPIYQLFPALVHVRLFGAGYHGLVTRLLDELQT